MSIELATQYQPYTDELFSIESKKSLVTNQDFDWTGAETIKVYRITTGNMNDYDRVGDGNNVSRYGPIERLGATTQSMKIVPDRSFTFAIDRLDEDETKRQLQSASALARQLREVVVPEVDSWVFNKMCASAGIKKTAVKLTASNIFDKIVESSAAMDDEFVPEDGRVLVVTPQVYLLMKKSDDIIMETDIAQDMRLRGVISNLDGLTVVRVPANRLPENFGFMIAHPVATVAPVKLASFMIHINPPFINGDLVEGRVNYDAFILDNKAKAVLYQPQPA